MRYNQPQNSPIVAERGGSGRHLILATLPGVELSNAVSGKRPSIPGTAPTATFIDADRYGKDRMFHPFPGANGYGGAQFGTETIGQGDDFTFVWVGRPFNPSDSFGKLMIRGQDGAGNGWSLMLAVGGGNADGSTAGNYVRASYVDTSPAQFDATLSGITVPVGGHQRLALVKRGSNIKVFHWATKQMVSATSGNGFLRSSTAGISLSLSTTGTPSGHSKANTVLAWDAALTDAEVWSHLDNPWQAIRTTSRRVSVASTGSTDTPVNPLSGALVLTGYVPTVAQTASQSVILNTGSLTLTGYAPTVARTANQAASPSVGSLSVMGYAPTISQAVNVAISPVVGAVSITGYTPSVVRTVSTSVFPGSGVLALAGYAPTVAQTASSSLSPASGQMALNGYAPSVMQTAPIVTLKYRFISLKRDYNTDTIHFSD